MDLDQLKFCFVSVNGGGYVCQCYVVLDVSDVCADGGVL